MTCFYAQGTVITVENEALAAQVIGGVQSFSLAGGAATSIDVTTLASTAKEFCVGLRDRGDLSMEIIRDFTDVGQIELDDSQADQSIRNYTITFENGYVLSFAGGVTTFDIKGAADDVIKSTATIKISGDITVTPP